MDGVGEYCIELIDLFLFDGFNVETSKVSGLIRLLDLFLFKAFLNLFVIVDLAVFTEEVDTSDDVFEVVRHNPLGSELFIIKGVGFFKRAQV